MRLRQPPCGNVAAESSDHIIRRGPIRQDRSDSMVKLSQFAVKGLDLLKADYDSSVVRRTLIFIVLIVPAFLANFLLYYFAARLLPADQFGLFYVANTVGNVIFSAALIFNVFFSRVLVHARQE